MKKQTLAIFISTGIFFPPEFCLEAGKELERAAAEAGYGTLFLPEGATKYGGVQSMEEAGVYAKFLKEHQGEYEGVILSLPNFGNENSALAALKDCGVPILIQAYPDIIGKMDVANRRDAFCGKISIMNLFHQAGLGFTAYAPHTVHPLSNAFKKQLHDFAAVCRVVKGMKNFTVGAVGARTTPFKTTRIDETALQKTGITVETMDLSEIFDRIHKVDVQSEAYGKKQEVYKNYCNWGKIPEASYSTIVKAAVILDEVIEEYHLNSLGIRCWNEFEKYLGICPCVILSELSNRGIPAACEVDVGNAVSMYALQLASNQPAVTLDWNNNYGDDENKCILFHCGPAARDMLAAESEIVDNPLQAQAHGYGHSWGASMARFKESPMTYLSAKTENGRLGFYIGQGRFTEDVLEIRYFGNAGVAEIPQLQKLLLGVGSNGFKHHVAVTLSSTEEILREAFSKYLNYEIVELTR